MSDLCRLRLLLVSATVALLLLAAGASARVITATVESPWQETAVLQEGCEWAGRTFGDRLFSRCLEDVWTHRQGATAQTSHGCRDMTQREQYDVLQAVLASWIAAGLVTNSRKDLFEMEMASRMLSPAVEAHYVLATDAMAQLNAGQAACDAEAFVVVRAGPQSAPVAVHQLSALAGALKAAQAGASPHSEDGAGELVQFLQAPIRELDHILWAAPEATVPMHVFLYGLVGDAKTRQWLQLLDEQRTGFSLTVSFRHLPVSTVRLCGAAAATASPPAEPHPQAAVWERPLHVQGYGATLDLKNMEYKVVDEKGASKAAHADADAAKDTTHTDGKPEATLDATLKNALEEQAIGGVNLTRLRSRYPELSVQLDAFASDVERLVGSEETKVSFDLLELQNLGLATVALIADRDEADRLTALADVASRFPFYASRLSKMAANPARLTVVKRELEALQRALRSGVTVAVLDGEVLSTEELSLFSVLKLLREKEARLEGLRTVVLLRRGELVHDAWHAGLLAQPSTPAAWEAALTALVTGRFRDAGLQAALSPTSGTSARLAVRSASVLWLNNVETDRRFARLSHRLDALTQDGAFAMPRRNVLNAVVVLDPTRMESIMALFKLLETLREGVPMRIGVVVVDAQSTGHFESYVDVDAQRLDGSSVASPFVLSVAAALFQLCRREGAAVEVIGRYLSLMAQGRFARARHPGQDAPADASNEAAARFFRETTHVALEDVLQDRSFQQYFYDTQEAVRTLGVMADGRSHVSLVNGRVAADLHTVLDQEVDVVAELVRAGQLHDDDDDGEEDLYDAILRAEKASSHFQPALESPARALSLHQPGAVAFWQDFPFLAAASYNGEVALVSQVVLLPCAGATLDDWRLATRAVAALAQCAPATADPSAGLSACHRTRLTVVSTCPQTAAHTDEPKADLLWRQLQGLVAAVQTVRESQRAPVVLDYMRAVSRACEMLPGAMALSDGNVVARVAAVQWSERVAKAMAKVDAHRAAAHEPLRLGFLGALSAAGAERGLPPDTHDRPRLLVNGRLILLDESFLEEDFVAASQQAIPLAQFALTTLEQLALAELAPSSSVQGFSADELDADLYAGKTAALSSFLASAGTNEGDVLQARLRTSMDTRHVAFDHVRTDAAVPARHQLVAVVDPTDRESQVLIAICQYLARAPLAVNVTVFLNPPVAVQRPVRDVFTYVATPTLQFDSASGDVVPPRAVFRGLPTEQLLTLGIVEPESWLVMPHRAQDDLDNIILAKLPRDRPVLSAAYRIHSLLVSGTAVFADGAASAAAGLPLSLRPVSARMSKATTNTLVMEKSGYYQLQATAGVWQMAVQPGPMSAAFTIDAIEKEGTTGGHVGAEGAPLVVVDSFASELVLATIGTRADHADAASTGRRGPSLLAEIAAAMANRSAKVWPPVGSAARPAARPEQPTLNIFSVASGHLYERFLRMMMYSVFRSSADVHGTNTTRIKFWVIENYLSPQFKAYIPKLAAHYGFEVGFVTYQWPWWLPKQTEKQRKIWAYKVLFLDVIFPLEVDRIIFVDADQTARADLHELYNMDIAGAPVAMTPFCIENMNVATKGFRFWTEGFWQKQLAGRPYHISAIFLVDLQRFRAMRAGDTYRRMYASLVSDPNSLANLDQDLPNLLQDRVPIYSLPEEWLWCETWCNTESKARAKTIDLCNNPLTKMPKLENAKMIVPDWEVTDNMLQSLAERLMDT